MIRAFNSQPFLFPHLTLRLGRLALALVALSAGVGVLGCSDASSSMQQPDTRLADELEGRKLFESAVGLLFNLEQYDEYNNQQALEQIVIRLNQWVQRGRPGVNWVEDPLLEQLPESYRRLGVVRTLGLTEFQAYDGLALREAVWLRKVADSVRGQRVDDVARATRLFDWVVRNIQLDPRTRDGRETSGMMSLAWHALLLGHGDANVRSWLFILLARQQRLQVAMLALADPNRPGALRPWVPALLSDGELYLFEPTLGIPIPAAGAQGVATLSQAVADEEILRRLDLDDEHAYPLESADLKKVVALVEASPPYLECRMKLFESHLAGEDSLVLSVEASRICERFAACPQVAEARLWHFPFQRYLDQTEAERELLKKQSQGDPEVTRAAMRESLAELLPFQAGYAALMQGRATQSVSRQAYAEYGFAPLWKGKVRHLMGAYAGEKSAIKAYQAARPPDEDIEQASLSQQDKEVYKRAKQHASYWLGLMAYERERYETAIDYFDNRTLKASPDGPWTSGARYNLARTYEALGRTEEAVALLEASRSPQRHGDRLRARRLRSRADGATTSP